MIKSTEGVAEETLDEMHERWNQEELEEVLTLDRVTFIRNLKEMYARHGIDFNPD